MYQAQSSLHQSFSPFPTQKIENLIECKHETSGIDIHVTPQERMIILDCQPLFSTSFLYQLYYKDSKLQSDTVSQENFNELIVSFSREGNRPFACWAL